MTASAIRFKGVSKRLGRTLALKDLSFDIPVGSVAAFVGNNGAGKTTTFSLVAGYLRLTSGSISVFDMPVRRFRRTS